MAESKYVVFRLGDERYAMPIESVERILPRQEVTRLPKTPKVMLGVFEMRGSTIPVIDARLRFELPQQGESHNFVVVLTQDGRCALSVDRVEGIVSLSEDAIEEKSAILDSKDDGFIRGIGKTGDQLLVVLEPDGLAPKSMKNRLAAAA
ncbi:MAG: chemotaxis protein CheW [Armatimonadetes bacterium]|jgi:purine-binding chemotaxis protein CheW|nr:chemotaxis protein CheW [Armatimonadota bacterium]